MVDMRSYQALVLLAIALVARAPAPYPTRHPEAGPFNEKDYWGSRGQGIATIHHIKRENAKAWPQQPYICHGVFVEFKRVLTACSCVAYASQPHHLSTPWYHETDPSWGVAKMGKDKLLVGVLVDEFLRYANDKLVNKAKVVDIKLSIQCSSDFRYNMAVLTLDVMPKGAKLAWIYSADKTVMRWATQRAVQASSTNGRCEVLRWANHGKPLKDNSRQEVKRARFHDSKHIRFDKAGNQRVVTAHAVTIVPWHECLEEVCPQFAPAANIKFMQNRRECFNEYNVTRYCVTWEQMDSLCFLPLGTPIFCDVGDLHGVFGILTNTTLWCEQSFNFKNVMIGIDTIMYGLPYLRIKNGPGYDEGWPEYLDILTTPANYELL